MLRFFLILFTLPLSYLTHAQEMLVIHSSHPQYQAGSLLDTANTLDLQQGMTLTVVFANGEVEKLKGPYHTTVNAPMGYTDNYLLTKLAKFINNADLYTPTLRVKPQEQPDDIWLVDISTTKRFYCVAPSNNVILWRPPSDSEIASTLLIKHKPSGKKVKVDWPAHQTTLDWPSELPVVYGDTYTVEVNTLRGQSTFKKLVLYQLPDSLPTKSHKVVWMVGRGCILQANMLLASLH